MLRILGQSLRTGVVAEPAPACDGGELGVSYASCGAVENVLPVDVKIPGYPPAPLDLLRRLLAAVEARRPGDRPLRQPISGTGSDS